MTIDRWLMLGLIFGTFVAPIVSVLIQFRISQPKPGPEKSELEKPIQKLNGQIFDSYLIPVLPLLAAAFNVYLLAREIHYAEPISRMSVVQISLLVALFFFNIVSSAFVILLQKIIGPTLVNIGGINDVAGDMNDHIGRLIHHMEKLHERVAILELSRLPSATPNKDSPPEVS